MERGYFYFNFINGSGKVREWQKEGNGIFFVFYDDYDLQELVFFKIFEFDKDWYLFFVIIKCVIKDFVVYNYFDIMFVSKFCSGMSVMVKECKFCFDGSNLLQIFNIIKISNKL